MPWEPLPSAHGPDPVPLRRGLDRLVRHLGAPPVDALSRIFEHWPDIVGEQLASVSRPVAVRNGVLTVSVADAAWASEFRWRSGSIVEAVGAATGDATVTEVVTRVSRRR